LGQATRWLCDRALEFYPESQFAKNYLRTHPGYQPLTQAAEPASAIGAAISTGVLPSDVPPEPAQSRRRSRRDRRLATVGKAAHAYAAHADPTSRSL
jgi:hypothetical protein